MEHNAYDQKTLVATAKDLLMKHRRMTEPEAHRYLQREAMDRRLTKQTVAVQIIHYYQHHPDFQAS